MFSIKIVDKETADIKISGVSRIVSIKFSDDMPTLINCLDVGVKLGKAGSKVWKSSIRITKNERFTKYGSPQLAELAGTSQYTLSAYSPLNSINHDLCNCQIVGFWDLIPENIRSKR